uniref:Uncharacterized protein n=1 Tax=Glossina brevipalpis TaxID=37001 RepID=A0A1A9W109_9MUSC
MLDQRIKEEKRRRREKKNKDTTKIALKKEFCRMWVPSEPSIVPKTLLKWTLTQSNAHNKPNIVAINDKKTKIKKKFKIISLKFKHNLILLATPTSTPTPTSTSTLTSTPTPTLSILQQTLSQSQLSLLAIETRIIKRIHLEEKRLQNTCTTGTGICRLNCERRKTFHYQRSHQSVKLKILLISPDIDIVLISSIKTLQVLLIVFESWITQNTFLNII